MAIYSHSVLLFALHLVLFLVLHRALQHQGFDIVERGEIEVKGKGKMTTYFLRQNLCASENEIMGLTEDILGNVDSDGKQREILNVLKGCKSNVVFLAFKFYPFLMSSYSSLEILKKLTWIHNIFGNIIWSNLCLICFA